MQVIGPPLNRCLLLVGADCMAWLAELPRTNLLPLQHNSRLPGQVHFVIAFMCWTRELLR